MRPQLRDAAFRWIADDPDPDDRAELFAYDLLILGDLPGPKLRLGDLEGDVAVLHSGSTVRMRGETNGTPGNPELLTVQWEGFAKAVHEGDDGKGKITF